jgi:hypothetical protein
MPAVSAVTIETPEVPARASRMKTKPRKRAELAVASAILAALAFGLYVYSRRTLLLTGTDTIVIGDFANTTGERVFDETLRRGLSVQLEQPDRSPVTAYRLVSELILCGRRSGQ